MFTLFSCIFSQASPDDPVTLCNESKGRVPYCFTRLMGHTSANEQIIVGHQVPASQLDCVNSVSEVFNNTRYTASMSASLKAMAVSDAKVCSDGLNVKGVGDELLDLEQQLHQERTRAQDCIGEIQELWNDVVSQKIFT